MTATDKIRETIMTLRQMANDLEQLIEAQSPDLEAVTSPGDWPIFDPELDAVPPGITPGPDGNRLEKDWCSAILWGLLRAHNVRQDRGATDAEALEIARAAGYSDRRGWNKWDGWRKDEDGNLWCTDVGIKNAADWFARIKRSLPEDLR